MPRGHERLSALAGDPRPNRAELYLLDTSVWIHALVRRRALTNLQRRVAELLRAAQVATIALVRLELLRGARDTAAYTRIERLLEPLRWLPLDDAVYDSAAQLGFRLRRSGVTVPIVDLVVAATAIRYGVIVVHLDTDYELIAKHSPLRTESHL